MKNLPSAVAILFAVSACTSSNERVPVTSSSQAEAFSIKQCSALAATKSGATCELQQLNSSAPNSLIVRGDILMPNGVLEGGSVKIKNGKITAVACDVSGLDSMTVLSCPGAAITPGLINAHDHLTYNQNAPGDWGQERYDRRNQWRKGLDGHTKINAPKAQDELQWAWAETRHVLAGTTSIAGSGGYSGFLRNVDRAELQQGLHGGVVDYDTFPLGDWSDVQGHDDNCDYPQLVSEEVLDNLVFLPHVGEGIDAYANNEIKCLTGRGYPGSPGVNIAASNDTFIHSVAATVPDAQVFKSSDMHLVWSPRSNISLYGNTAPVTLYDTMGIAVALATDWTASGSINLFQELSCAASYNEQYLDGYFSDYELWRMVTINAAEALGFANQIGAIKVGMLADIAIVKYQGESSAYSAVIDANIDAVALVMRAGQPLYGDQSLLDQLIAEPGQCESLQQAGLPLCGTEKALCVQQELGISLQELLAHNPSSASYPMYFCEAPADEPSCLPARPGQYSGLVTQNDADGDGIENSKDNCASVFNPIRPMDNNTQADYDQDGIGDVCDVSPAG
ncbi:amidohydrolase family protein [Agaribacterium haliotis]|uniref:amidohydrolase family protein n=1 Tax=Agaribacterium haliotis TaxID=2013869 RepID=UPI000BB56CE4|nr:amidohydrolase family protein [Agaribacterium haliotis]